MSKEVNSIEWDLVGDEIHRTHKGNRTVVGTFVDGRLEFENADIEKKYRTGTVTFIESDDTHGGLGLPVKSFGIKGLDDKPKEDEPDMPKEDPKLGDMSPALVRWYYDNRRNEFKIRYGVIPDKNGKVQKVFCRRERWDLVKSNPKESDVKEWTKSFEVLKNMILARRGTQLTATQETVISEDDYNSYVDAGGLVDVYASSQAPISVDE